MSMEGLFQKHCVHFVPTEPRQRAQAWPARINITWRWIVDHKKGCGLGFRRRSADWQSRSFKTWPEVGRSIDLRQWWIGGHLGVPEWRVCIQCNHDAWARGRNCVKRLCRRCWLRLRAEEQGPDLSERRLFSLLQCLETEVRLAQRQCQNGKEEWERYCDDEGEASHDPGQHHDASFMFGFLQRIGGLPARRSESLREAVESLPPTPPSAACRAKVSQAVAPHGVHATSARSTKHSIPRDTPVDALLENDPWQKPSDVSTNHCFADEAAHDASSAKDPWQSYNTRVKGHGHSGAAVDASSAEDPWQKYLAGTAGRSHVGEATPCNSVKRDTRQKYEFASRRQASQRYRCHSVSCGRRSDEASWPGGDADARTRSGGRKSARDSTIDIAPIGDVAPVSRVQALVGAITADAPSEEELWEEYVVPGTKRRWLHCITTGEFFFPDKAADDGWECYRDPMLKAVACGGGTAELAVILLIRAGDRAERLPLDVRVPSSSEGGH
eukprot:CAMPEP_0117584670 /NCGR_PEP_ID=MMETSP0784-20121206/67731_1 /TAXON_ID=39447 /ORGANISM="" /LENGTH=497 /DNA_ID=CAMNT_0005385557 /DNA_START=27 /DNA_END=1521 /DNA_ORIENTATION=-